MHPKGDEGSNAVMVEVKCYPWGVAVDEMIVHSHAL